MIRERIREFYLKRNVDVSGTSGTGIVARGVVLASGQCVMEWMTLHSSIAIYKNIDDVRLIHGHDGATEVIIGDPYKKKVKKNEKRSKKINKRKNS